MRVRRLKDRTPKQRPFYIDIVLQGSGFISGGVLGRFRCPGETRSAKLHAQRCEMIVDLWQRGRTDILVARLARRFTTDRLHVAYKRGEAALEVLLRSSAPSTDVEDSAHARLDHAIEEYLAFNLKMRDAEKPRARIMMMRFVEWLEGQSARDGAQQNGATAGNPGRPATVRDLTTQNVVTFLSQLSSRRHRKGRPVSAATKNRYRTVLGGLARRLKQRKLLDEHFISDGGLAKFGEGGARLPSWTVEERHAYVAAIGARRPEFLPVFYLLANTGADIAEVLSRRVRDVRFGEQLTRIDYRRTKTDTLPRLVPLHSAYAAVLRDHIATYGLTIGDRLFGMFRRHDIENTHERARTAIGRGTWREMCVAARREHRPEPEPDECDPIRIKDLRHFSAIAWAMAGVPIERIADYLGHSTIRLTMIYARFRPTDEYDAPLIERAYALMNRRSPE